MALVSKYKEERRMNIGKEIKRVEVVRVPTVVRRKNQQKQPQRQPQPREQPVPEPAGAPK